MEEVARIVCIAGMKMYPFLDIPDIGDCIRKYTVFNGRWRPYLIYYPT